MKDEAEIGEKLSGRDRSAQLMLTQLRHWLTETERDAATTVDLVDPQAIRDCLNLTQAIVPLSLQLPSECDRSNEGA